MRQRAFYRYRQRSPLDANTVFGLRVPASTPAPVITRLNAEINKILAMQAVKDRIAGQR